jgi:Flp pilus assembly pilin Flp
MTYSNICRFLTTHRSTLMDTAAGFSRCLWREEDGQDLVEYSLLMACVALGSMAALSGLKGSVGDLWNSANKTLSSAVAAAS